MILAGFALTFLFCTVVNAGRGYTYDPPCYPHCPPDKICSQGICKCKRGQEHNGKCVECVFPRVYKSCPTKCPRNCDHDPNNPIFCTRECDLSKYCVCADGYVETSASDSRCIKKEECPLYCKPPKVRINCIPACKGTCEYPNGKPGCQKDLCLFAISCGCPPGYVEKSETDSTCVKLEDCPKKCEAPKVYTDCATSCPDLCTNVGRGPTPCIFGCRPGVNCVCPKDYVERNSEDSTCIQRSKCKCHLPKDPGPCEASIPSYFFNAQTGKCEMFNYGGCQGNANRFESKKECEDSCSVCKLEKDPGPCKARFPRYFYNRHTGDCEKFYYGGCRGNANRFKSLAACRAKCADPCIKMLCPKGTICQNGKCIDLCTMMLCSPGTICVKGECIASCAATTCLRGTICKNGKCYKPCGRNLCPPNASCFFGRCFYY